MQGLEKITRHTKAHMMCAGERGLSVDTSAHQRNWPTPRASLELPPTLAREVWVTPGVETITKSALVEQLETHVQHNQ